MKFCRNCQKSLNQIMWKTKVSNLNCLDSLIHDLFMYLLFVQYSELKSETKADEWKSKVANHMTKLFEKKKLAEEQYLNEKQITEG